MNTLYSNRKKVTVKKNIGDNINCSVPFALNDDSRTQELQIDPGDTFYNPSTKTLHAPKISGAYSTLIEGSAIEITQS